MNKKNDVEKRTIDLAYDKMQVDYVCSVIKNALGFRPRLCDISRIEAMIAEHMAEYKVLFHNGKVLVVSDCGWADPEVQLYTKIEPEHILDDPFEKWMVTL